MESAALSSTSWGICQVIEADREPTAPITLDLHARGPGPRELARLAAGELATVELGGRYRLDALLGKGGMARVYRGELLALGRPVAVKVLDDARGDRPTALRRFMTEARITASVRHPNVVDISDFGTTPEGLVYLVTELLDGEDLRQVLRREGPLPWARVRHLILQICAGLAAVHERGVVHRDLKPSNCLRVTTEFGETVKLIDFGIALASPDGDANGDDNIVGTPEYMSPEQTRGEPVDGRSDVYSLGIVLAELLTGQVPFVGKTAAAIMTAQASEPAPALRLLAGLAEVDPDIEAVYRKALAKDPAARFASVRELAEAIAAIPASRELEAPRRRVERHPRLFGLAAAILVAALGTGYGLLADASAPPSHASCEAGLLGQ